MKQALKFAKETDLCAAFIAAVDKRVWTPYAETGGWDILLSRKIDGFQIGVQAKLRMNVEVINQAIDDYGAWCAASPAPDCRAVLVPHGAGFGKICAHLGLVVVVMHGKRPQGCYGSRFTPDLPSKPGDCIDESSWPEWAPTARVNLPEYVPDVAAGASAPLQLTSWKIKAIKLAVLLELNGFVVRADFRHLDLDHRRWLDGKWLVLDKTRGGYIAGSYMRNYKALHPKVYEQVKADAAKWMPKQTAMI